MIDKIILNPIGIVRHNYTDIEVASSLSGVEGIIEIFPEYELGLKAIDGFSHIILIAYLHKVSDEDRKILVIRHKRLLRFGFKLEELPESGVFASDSPVRPNPIALSIVKVNRRDGRFLYVSNLDLFNGTPILDIKPYTPDRALKEFTLPKWYLDLSNKVKKRIGIEFV